MAGCRGREDCGVQLCAGTSFVLIDLELLNFAEQVAVQSYVFKLMRMETAPITEYNAVMNSLLFLKQYVPAPRFDATTEWVSLHKQCGLYLYHGAYE